MSGLYLIVAFALGGLILLYLEIFLPGMVAGILGVISLLASVVKAHAVYGARGALITFLSEILLIIGVLWSWSSFFQKTSLGKRMFLTEYGHPPEYEHEKKFSVGDEGVTVSELRPAGTAEFNGARCDVVSESAFISAGEKVKILQIEKYRVLVRKL